MRKTSLVALMALVASTSALADSPWAVNIGVSELVAASNTGNLANNTFTSSVTNAVALTPAIRYTINPAFQAELLLGNPISHDVKLTGGGLQSGKEVSFKELPPTLSLKYLFAPDAEFSPYVGVGVNYTLVFSVKAKDALAGNDVKAGNSFGAATNVGFEYRPKNSAWGFGADARYIGIRSEVKLNGAKIGTLAVNPWVYTLGAVYHFN